MEDQFLKAIADAPDDDSLKLVYADFLDEQGDPRGQALRLACELRRVLSENEIPDEWIDQCRIPTDRNKPVVLDIFSEFPCIFYGATFEASVQRILPGPFDSESGSAEIELKLRPSQLSLQRG